MPSKYLAMELAVEKASKPTLGVVFDTEVSFDPSSVCFEDIQSSEVYDDPETILIRRERDGDYNFSLITRGNRSNAK
jgi:hypothetical protein